MAEMDIAKMIEWLESITVFSDGCTDAHMRDNIIATLKSLRDAGKELPAVAPRHYSTMHGVDLCKAVDHDALRQSAESIIVRQRKFLRFAEQEHQRWIAIDADHEATIKAQAEEIAGLRAELAAPSEPQDAELPLSEMLVGFLQAMYYMLDDSEERTDDETVCSTKQVIAFCEHADKLESVLPCKPGYVNSYPGKIVYAIQTLERGIETLARERDDVRRRNGNLCVKIETEMYQHAAQKQRAERAESALKAREGFVSVPVEPTEAMKLAGLVQLYNCKPDTPLSAFAVCESRSLIKIYQAMLAAQTAKAEGEA